MVNTPAVRVLAPAGSEPTTERTRETPDGSASICEALDSEFLVCIYRRPVLTSESEQYLVHADCRSEFIPHQAMYLGMGYNPTGMLTGCEGIDLSRNQSRFRTRYIMDAMKIKNEDSIGNERMMDGSDAQPNDFSLVMGGPLYQLLLRSRILNPEGNLMKRRLVLISLLAWAPLLVLSIIQGTAVGDQIHVPFLSDIEVHVRFLVALPFLIFSEVIVHKRLSPAVKQFIQRNIIRVEDRPKFEQILASTMRLRNSIIIELLLVGLVLTVGHYLWLNQMALSADTWFARIDNGEKQLTLAGNWYSWVSIPTIQFILLRWYFRLTLWVRALFLIAKLDLHLMPSHPDRCGGLGFLGGTAYAFSTLLFAQGALLSGLIAGRIFYEGQKLPMFKMEIFAMVLVAVLMVLIPLFVFAPKLLAAKRQGLRDYGLLASDYVRQFEKKWIDGDHETEEGLLGTGDIQSLADLNNSFDVVRGMRAVPFTRDTVVQLCVATLLPLAPLVLTMIPFEELVGRLLGVLI